MATKKRTTTRKRASKRVAPEEMKSFQVYPEKGPFITFKLTRQTFYWVILVLVIVVMQIWIIKQQLEIANLTEALNTMQISE